MVVVGAFINGGGGGGGGGGGCEAEQNRVNVLYE